MRAIKYIILLPSFLILSSCITQFIPEIEENQELLVVKGLITDQPGVNTIKLSKSFPLGGKSTPKPVKGSNVWITDDLGSLFTLTEKEAGTYVTNPLNFQGAIGRKYILHIKTNTAYVTNYSYESLPMELKPVPGIDSVYYEKKLLKARDGYSSAEEGAQVYINTHDPSQLCKFYRWDYTETWEFKLPFSAPPNRICWITSNSGVINIKSTSVLAEDVISRYPLSFISNTTDRLKVKYSMLVNQYSLNEEEFDYWEKLQNITQNVGSLYDITPASIPSNIYCIENPAEKVLGYFSVSARSSKRIFIKDVFFGIVNLYNDCISDTIYGSRPIPNLGTYAWVLEDVPFPELGLPYKVITNTRGCADCTVRGSKIEPDFWNSYK